MQKLSVSGLLVPEAAFPAAGDEEKPPPAGILHPRHPAPPPELTRSLFLTSSAIYIKPEGASNF